MSTEMSSVASTMAAAPTHGTALLSCQVPGHTTTAIKMEQTPAEAHMTNDASHFKPVD